LALDLAILQFNAITREGGMRQSLGLIALILFVAGLSFVLSAQDQQGARPINVSLTGAVEAPGPGDPDGTGTARLTFTPGKSQICY